MDVVEPSGHSDVDSINDEAGDDSLVVAITSLEDATLVVMRPDYDVLMALFFAEHERTDIPRRSSEFSTSSEALATTTFRCQLCISAGISRLFLPSAMLTSRVS